jgi:hypothetical protein
MLYIGVGSVKMDCIHLAWRLDPVKDFTENGNEVVNSFIPPFRNPSYVRYVASSDSEFSTEGNLVLPLSNARIFSLS